CAFRHHELAVENAARNRQLLHGRNDLRKVPVERLARLGAEVDVVAILERETAKPIPLGLVLPLWAFRQRVDAFRLHGRVVDGKRQIHGDYRFAATSASSTRARSNRPRGAATGAQSSPR